MTSNNTHAVNITPMYAQDITYRRHIDRLIAKFGWSRSQCLGIPVKIDSDHIGFTQFIDDGTGFVDTYVPRFEENMAIWKGHLRELEEDELLAILNKGKHNDDF